MKKLDHYFLQPTKLPEKLVKMIPQDILHYAFWDLSESLEFTSGWLAITQEKLYVFENDRLVFEIAFNELKEIREFDSLGMCGIEFATPTPVFHIRYTNRQKLAMTQVIYLVNQILEGETVYLHENADEYYFSSLTKNLDKEQRVSTEEKTNVAKRLLGYVVPYKKEVIVGGFAAVMATLVSLGPAFLSGKLVDSVIKAYQNNTITHSVALDMAWKFLGLLIACYFTREFFIWIRLKRMSIMGEKVASDLRKELYSHLQKLDMDFYSKKQTGSIISRVSSDTDRIWDFIAFGIVEVSIAIVTLISLSAVLIGLDWKLGAIMTLPVPIVIYSIYRHGKKMERLFLKCWRKWSDLTDVLSDTIPGIQVVKAFNQEKREVKRFNKRNHRALDEFENIHHVWTKFWPKMMVSIHIMVLLVWFFAIPRLLGSTSDPYYLSAGTFVSFLLYMTMFSQPIEIIGQMARMMNRATSSAFRIFEILDTKPSLKTSGTLKKKVEGSIDFEKVIFSYDGIRQVIKGVDLSIKPGEMVGFVGPSGGGKTTLTKLLFRFYDVKSGSIKIDGVDLRDFEIGSYRQQVGMVLQDPYLFHGSILDNICYGLPNADKKDIIQAAKIANAHEFIMKLPEAYQTTVGERGQTLSGGEKQRISIARAILHDPKILILDEATSAVDTETERKIQDALDKLIEGRTVIAIAHRLSTLRKASRILVVKEGKVVEEGTHKKLMSKKGEYFKLQNLQLSMDSFEGEENEIRI